MNLFKGFGFLNTDYLIKEIEKIKHSSLTNMVNILKKSKTYITKIENRFSHELSNCYVL